ncbi:MAG: FeoA family protein [Gemmatimonadota bacterium]|nr:FeoA family protein [Gemmatimonadota bacterium]
MTLSNIEAGKVVRMVSIEGGSNLRARLASMGLLPGVEIQVVKNLSAGPFIVQVKGSRLVLGRGMAQKIVVS